MTAMKSAFELHMPNSIHEIILEVKKRLTTSVLGKKLKELDKTHLDAYLGLLILAGV